MGMFSVTRGAFSPHRELREWEDERERLRNLSHAAANLENTIDQETIDKVAKVALSPAPRICAALGGQVVEDTYGKKICWTCRNRHL